MEKQECFWMLEWRENKFVLKYVAQTIRIPFDNLISSLWKKNTFKTWALCLTFNIFLLKNALYQEGSMFTKVRKLTMVKPNQAFTALSWREYECLCVSWLV
jgi:hypothetical protein